MIADSADFIIGAAATKEYGICSRTLDRHGIPSYRLGLRGKKLYRRSEIEAALKRNASARSEKACLDAIVDRTVEEVLSGISQ